MSFGHGDRPGKIAREVAAAFYAGKKCKRSNCRTDGETYWLFDNAIAKRIKDDDIAAAVAANLLGQSTKRLVEYTWAGWLTDTTERHLKALGVPGVWKGRDSKRDPHPPTICDKPVSSTEWYTLEEAAQLPMYVPPQKPRRGQPLVNLTKPLFA